MFTINKIKKIINIKLFSTDKIIQNTTVNIYKGAIFNLSSVLDENTNIDSFEKTLDSTLLNWQNSNIKSITVTISHIYSDYISLFVKKGFYFHHCKDNNLVLCKWLDKTIPDKLPKYAHYNVGVGACIINKNSEFLLIKEKFSPFTKVALWKFVTGLIDDGESIIQATVREVKEEVGLNVKFIGCISVAERYPNSLKISDMCFFNVCILEDDSAIVIDETEVVEAKYFKIDEIETMVKNDEIALLSKVTLEKIMQSIKNTNKISEFISNIKLLNEKEIIDANKIYNSIFNIYYH